MAIQRRGGKNSAPYRKAHRSTCLPIDRLYRQNTPDKAKLIGVLLDIKAKLKRVAGASDEEAAKVFREDKELAVKKLIDLSKCPDYVVNKGHYFGTSFFKEEPPISDDDKRALIEYLKTFYMMVSLTLIHHVAARASIEFSDDVASQHVAQCGDGIGNVTLRALGCRAGCNLGVGKVIFDRVEFFLEPPC